MADNTKIGPIFRSANGGLSDDLFTGVKNSFYYSNNIEIREDAKSIYPKQTPRQGYEFDLGQTVTAGGIQGIGYVRSAEYIGGYWYVFTSKDVFKLDLGSETATSLGVSGWITEAILDAELFNGNVYFTTTNHLYMISQSAADANWATKSNFTEISLKESEYHPLYSTTVLLAVGNDNKVGKVTKEIPNQLQDGITLQTDYKVRFLDELGGYLRITATDGYYGNEILLWDKVNTVADEVIPMVGYKFLQSCIYNGYHYLLSDKGLGLVNGYQFYILKRAQEEENYVSQTANDGMLVYNDKLYLVTSKGIYIYGAKNKNYTDVINLWSAPLSSNGKPWALSTDGNYLLYSETIDKSGVLHSYVYLYKDGEYNGSRGEFQTMGYFGNSLSEIKQSMYLRVGYDLPSGTIDIYYRTEATPSGTWIRLTTPPDGLSNSSDMRSPFATTLKLNCRFQWIQFKFVLRGVGTKLYSADLYYNDMLD